jgi:hypothetical protein
VEELLSAVAVASSSTAAAAACAELTQQDRTQIQRMILDAFKLVGNLNPFSPFSNSSFLFAQRHKSLRDMVFAGFFLSRNSCPRQNCVQR